MTECRFCGDDTGCHGLDCPQAEIDAAFRDGARHGLLVGAWQAQGLAEAAIANGERGSSALWWHITDLRRLASDGGGDA